MKRRFFLAACLACSLTAPARAEARSRRTRDRRSRREPAAPPSYAMERTRNGWRTTALLALGTILVLDSGEECEVVAVESGYSWCVPAP